MLHARTRVCAFENTHIATSSSTLAEAGVNGIVQVATRVAWSNFVSPRYVDDDPIANGNVSEVTGRGETVRVFTTLLRDGQLFMASPSHRRTSIRHTCDRSNAWRNRSA
jgi:hypothetical protein